MYVAVGKYRQMSLIKIFVLWCQWHNTGRPSINLDDGLQHPNIEWKHVSVSYPRIWYSCLLYDWCIYFLLWCYIIYSLYSCHITISILALDYPPSKYIYECQKWCPSGFRGCCWLIKRLHSGPGQINIDISGCCCWRGWCVRYHAATDPHLRHGVIALRSGKFCCTHRLRHIESTHTI